MCLALAPPPIRAPASTVFLSISPLLLSLESRPTECSDQQAPLERQLLCQQKRGKSPSGTTPLSCCSYRTTSKLSDNYPLARGCRSYGTPFPGTGVPWQGSCHPYGIFPPRRTQKRCNSRTGLDFRALSILRLRSGIKPKRFLSKKRRCEHGAKSKGLPLSYPLAPAAKKYLLHAKHIP
jgi:hypothetical protein